jgi:hypothetical protein
MVVSALPFTLYIPKSGLLPAAASAAQGARIHSERPQMQIFYGNQKQRASARRAESRVKFDA